MGSMLSVRRPMPVITERHPENIPEESFFIQQLPWNIIKNGGSYVKMLIKD